MIDYLGKRYGIEPYEFEGRGGRQLLVSAGTGLMLSVMDHVPRLRWCIDVDTFTQEQKRNLPDWLACAGNVTERVIVIGWFCSTNPKPLADAAARLRATHRLVYVQFHGVGNDPFRDMRTAQTLDELLKQAND